MAEIILLLLLDKLFSSKDQEAHSKGGRESDPERHEAGLPVALLRNKSAVPSHGIVYSKHNAPVLVKFLTDCATKKRRSMENLTVPVIKLS